MKQDTSKRFGDRAFGQRSIDAQRTNDLTSEGVNDEDEILNTMHEAADKKTGDTKGKISKGNYGDERGVNQLKYANRGKESPDDAKLAKQNKSNDRMYTYLQ